jgi:hypothetical protein
VTRRAATDLGRLARLVARRDGDLLVAADERVDPYETFFDGWARMLATERLDTTDRRALYRHFEREYDRIRGAAVTTDRVDDLARAAAPSFQAVGVAAARADLQWAVSRATEHRVDLSLRTNQGAAACRDDLERIADAGGRAGISDALARLRARWNGGETTPDADGRAVVTDPITDGNGPAAGPRPVRVDENDELGRLLPAVGRAVG